MFSLCAQRDLKCSSRVNRSRRGGRGGGGLLQRLKLPHANADQVEQQQQQRLFARLLSSIPLFTFSRIPHSGQAFSSDSGRLLTFPGEHACFQPNVAAANVALMKR